MAPSAARVADHADRALRRRGPAFSRSPSRGLDLSRRRFRARDAARRTFSTWVVVCPAGLRPLVHPSDTLIGIDIAAAKEKFGYDLPGDVSLLHR